MSYRSFIRPPRAAEQYLGGGLSCAQSERAVRAQLARLSNKLLSPIKLPSQDTDRVEPWENPGIPAGYTYLAQFVAHDCVNSSVPTGAQSRGAQVRNQRAKMLSLHTLYGTGLDGCAHAVSSSARGNLGPVQLQLGRMKIGEKVGSQCPFRDLPRTSVSNSSDLNRPALSGVAIADDRNDNNALIAQLTAAFMTFHNAVVRRVHSAATERTEDVLDWRGYLNCYYEARALVTETYRRIVREDLARRLLHPAVYEHYSVEKPTFVDGGDPNVVPREFAIALRFGHSMVRPRYRINNLLGRQEELIDVLLTTGRGRPWRMPLDETWIVQWSNFFQLDGQRRPNLSRRIGPTFSTDLVSKQVFDSIDCTGMAGLPYRDLISGAVQGPWSVSALIQEIREIAPSLGRSSRLMTDREYRFARVRSWLSEDRAAFGLTDDDVERIAQDPPLLLFILFEAAHEMNGKCLGVLGSILIADTIFRALAAPLEDEQGSETILPGDRMRELHDRLGSISSMPELILFVAEESDLLNAAVPFI